MNKKILKALRGSIKKWEKIVNGTGRDKGSRNCPLCQVFLLNCNECPINKKTNMGCVGSPYSDFYQHNIYEHRRMMGWGDCPECRRLAKEELEFLKGLLPLRRRGLNENISKNK